MTYINTPNAPKAIGPYSQAIVSGGLVFTSGIIPVIPETGEIDGSDIKAQTKRVCENIKALLSASGSSIEKAVKTTCYIKNMADFASFNEVYGSYFTSKPARSCIEASDLPKHVLLEIDVIAEI